MNVSLRQLRAFVAIYQEGRLAAAGQALSITPSAASLLLKQLEETLSVRLFDRSPQGLQPTAAAHATITAVPAPGTARPQRATRVRASQTVTCWSNTPSNWSPRSAQT